VIAIGRACFRRKSTRQAGMVFASRPTMTPPMAGEDWSAIDAHDVQTLETLFERDAERLSAFSMELGGLYFDWAKTHLDAALLDAFVAVTRSSQFAVTRDALFAGADVNPTEGRPAEHVAERGTGAPDAVELAAARRGRMRSLVDAIEAGAFGDVTGVLHIGIGGSVLGPALLVDALGRQTDRIEVRIRARDELAICVNCVRMPA